MEAESFSIIGILILNSVHSFFCVYFYAFVSQRLPCFFFFRCGRKPECCNQGSRLQESAGQTVVSVRSWASARSISAVSLLVHPSKRCPLSSLALRHFTIRHCSEHICVSCHLPWIACVRVRAWAGHRPLPGNSSHLDSLQLISCDFFFFLLWSYFFLRTLGPGMDVPEAGKHVKKSTSQKLEDQKKVMQKIFFFFFFFGFRFFKFVFIYVLMFVLLLQQKQQHGSAFPDVHLYSHASLGMWVGGSFFFFNNCCCFCIPTWCCASYLLIAI